LTLDIVDYDPRWPAMYEAERDRLASALGPRARRIEHNGSTSVPGLAAKPIIDIQISVATLSPLQPLVDALAPLGYVHVPHADDAFCPFLHRPVAWPHTYHVHFVEAGGLEERRTLAFRDYLRAHDEAAREYEQLKRALAAQTDATDPAAREAYAHAKSAFIERILRSTVV
jgi:GrpB-like predicted nucleotidyltransferase (UPF0157 family)